MPNAVIIKNHTWYELHDIGPNLSTTLQIVILIAFALSPIQTDYFLSVTTQKSQNFPSKNIDIHPLHKGIH